MFIGRCKQVVSDSLEQYTTETHSVVKAVPVCCEESRPRRNCLLGHPWFQYKLTLLLLPYTSYTCTHSLLLPVKATVMKLKFCGRCCRTTLDRLTNGLASENERWGEEVERLQNRLAGCLPTVQAKYLFGAYRLWVHPDVNTLHGPYDDQRPISSNKAHCQFWQFRHR